MDEYDVDKLARYNSEVARGLVHTEAWSTQMRLLQMRFDDEQRNRKGVVHLQPPAEQESLKGQAPPGSPDPKPQP